MATWEGELEKQILSGAFISSFASHPALKMNRCQEKASHPQGKSKRKAMNTSSTQSFLLFYINKICVCVCVCVYVYFNLRCSLFLKESSLDICEAAPWVPVVGPSFCSV